MPGRQRQLPWRLTSNLRASLDECAIYGSFLGDSEVLAHYNATLPSAPVAQTPVADQPTNYVSLTTTFTENAVGQNLHYAWTKVGVGPVGSDSPTLILSGLALGDAGSYQCRSTTPAEAPTRPRRS